MWRNLINRITRRRGSGLAATQAWEVADRRAAHQWRRDLAQRRRAAHLYGGPTP